MTRSIEYVRRLLIYSMMRCFLIRIRGSKKPGIIRAFIILIIAAVFSSCSVSKSYNPNKKFTPEELKKDYTLLREILEEKHPSLYWYTSKDSMDYYFDEGFRNIQDSMTELTFGWKIIAPLLYNIRCGHTSFMMSREWQKFIRGKTIPSFPLYSKVSKDSMMVVVNRNEDSIVKKGYFLSSINGLATKKIIDTLFQYMSGDGYADNLKYIRLSASFPFYYRNVFGLYPFYRVTFTDSAGLAQEAVIPWWAPVTDTTDLHKKKERKKRPPKIKGNEKRERIRSVKYGSNYALMDINSFTKGRLGPFFRRTFRDLKKEEVGNLIIDLRINGGGEMDKAVKLTQYIRQTNFRVADSAYSISKNFNPYSGYIKNSLQYNLGLIFLSKKGKESHFHFGYWERHRFKPKRKNHYSGNVYVLTNGLTFSAASLFCNLVKGQSNVLLVGEETGGGWYGNSGIFIPNIVLPETKLRVRLPFFRLVQYQHKDEHKGEGVSPDWYIGPDWEDVINNVDTKLEAVLERIKKSE